MGNTTVSVSNDGLVVFVSIGGDSIIGEVSEDPKNRSIDDDPTE